MHFLNSEIEALTKRKKTHSLVKQEISCGIFQDYGEDIRVEEVRVLKK